MILQLLNIKIIFAGNQRQAKKHEAKCPIYHCFHFYLFLSLHKSTSTIHHAIP